LITGVAFIKICNPRPSSLLISILCFSPDILHLKISRRAHSLGCSFKKSQISLCKDGFPAWCREINGGGFVPGGGGSQSA
jgi:hypothetical protein